MRSTSTSTGNIVLTRVDTPLGTLAAGARPDGICLLEYTSPERLPVQIETLRKLFRCEIVDGDSQHLTQLRRELQAYFAGSLRQFSVPLVAPGTPFQERVWQELLRIPFGETRSYEDLAVTLGSPQGLRAVGRANGTNRIAIVIPCHRVVNKDGGLGGYGGLLWRKEALLHLEAPGLWPQASELPLTHADAL